MEKYVFDFALCVVAIIVIVSSARRGFTLSLLNTISIAVSSILSYKISKPLSEFIYSSFLSDRIELKFNEVLSRLSQDISLNEKINALIEALPKGLVNASRAFGFDLDASVASFKSIDLSNDAIAKAFTDNVALDIINPILGVITLIVTFVAIFFVLKLVSVSFNKIVRKLPIVGKVNTFFGGVLGVVKAGVAVVAVCLIVSTIVFSVDSPKLENIISQSFVYNFIIENTF